MKVSAGSTEVVAESSTVLDYSINSCRTVRFRGENEWGFVSGLRFKRVVVSHVQSIGCQSMIE